MSSVRARCQAAMLRAEEGQEADAMLSYYCLGQQGVWSYPPDHSCNRCSPGQACPEHRAPPPSGSRQRAENSPFSSVFGGDLLSKEIVAIFLSILCKENGHLGESMC